MSPLEEVTTLLRHGPMPLNLDEVPVDLEVRATRIHLNTAQLFYWTGHMWPSTREPPYRISAGWLWVVDMQNGVLVWYLDTVF